MTYREKLELARNPNTPVSLLETFAKDEEWYVRYYVASYPNIPKYTIIEMLLVEENKKVSEKLRERLNKEEVG